MAFRLTDSRTSALRALLRAIVVCVTAFGLKLSVEQVAAIQLVAEAALVVVTQFTTDKP